MITINNLKSSNLHVFLVSQFRSFQKTLEKASETRGFRKFFKKIFEKIFAKMAKKYQHLITGRVKILCEFIFHNLKDLRGCDFLRNKVMIKITNLVIFNFAKNEYLRLRNNLDLSR